MNNENRPQEDRDENESASNGIFLILAMFVLIFGLLFLFPPPRYFETGQSSIYDRIGIPTHEFDPMLQQIKSDIKQENIEIRVLIGNFYDYGFGVGLLDASFYPTYYILLDSGFLSELTPEEKLAIVAHEAGHIPFQKQYRRTRMTEIQNQVDADTFAAKYVQPKHLISMLEKAYLERSTRMSNLKKLDPDR